jgi:hypothetical protein
MIYIIYLLSLVCMLFSAFFLVQWWRERAMLLQTVRRVTGKAEGYNTTESIAAIKRFLTEHISYDTEKREAKRPLLRQSAATTLRTGFGFCGENARVAVLMLNYAGIRAGRVYLFGNRWNHVVVENLYHNQWYLFDAHRDPGVLLPDEWVCKIPIGNIASFPNEYREQNIWVESCRIKIARKVKPLAGMAQWRLPKPLAILSESPDLIQALVLLILGAAFLALPQLLNLTP